MTTAATANSAVPPPGFDAREWVAAWVNAISSHPNVPRDEGAMLAWFSGAIMRGFDEANKRAEASKERLGELLVGVVDLASGWDEDGALGPREPLSWETVARMAMDDAASCLRELGIDHPARQGENRPPATVEELLAGIEISIHRADDPALDEDDGP